MMAASPAWLVAAPLVGAILAFVLQPERRGGVALLLGGVTAICGVVTWTICGALLRGGAWRVAVGAWPSSVGIGLNVDGLSAAFLAIVWLVLLAASTDAWRSRVDPRSNQLADDVRAARTFWPLWFLLWAGLNALFLTADLFNLYVCLELVGLTSVALVASAGGAGPLRAALRYFFVNVAASLAFFLGVALVYHRYEALDFQRLASLVRPDGETTLALSLLSGALLFKAAIVPLHGWLPAAHAAAPAPVSALLSALVVEAPLYLLLRLWWFCFPGLPGSAAAALIGVLGSAGLVWGSLQAIRAVRLKELVAYSTVAQIGLLLVAVPLVRSSANPRAWAGLVFLAAAHALAKAAMFLAAGGVARAYGHDRLSELAGFGTRHPVHAYALGLAGMSLMGVPGTGGFMGKWLLATSPATPADLVWVVIIAGSALLTAGYVWRVLVPAIRPEPRGAPQEGGAQERGWAALALALAALLLGVASAVPDTLIRIGLPVLGGGP